MSGPPQGFVDPNRPSPGGPNDAPIIIYGYVPNFALCLLGIILFAVASAVHLILSARYRAWYFLPMTFACAMEVVGYAARTLSSKKNPYNVIYFVIAYFFIVTAPVLITATIYVCLNKLISWASSQGYNASWLRPKAILWGFITCDVLSTGIQIAGAALIGKAESNREDPTTANNILLAGLAFQAIAFLIFLILLLAFIISMTRSRNIGSSFGGQRVFISALLLSSIFIYIRIIFRLAETATGISSYLSTHEAFFGALEFAPVVIAVYLLIVWHPGRCLKSVTVKH